MAAIDVLVKDGPCVMSCRRLLMSVLLASSASVLLSCASTEELYAQYDEEFCPADGREVVVNASAKTKTVEKIVERVVVKEVPGSGPAMLTWEPAVYFKSDDTDLSRTARRALETNVSLLNKFPRHLVAIRGFTDSHSSESYNRALAQKRIAAVKKYLVKKGLEDVRVVGTSHGESVPLAGNQSGIADNINRRVELLLLDSKGRPVPSRQPVVLGPSD